MTQPGGAPENAAKLHWRAMKTLKSVHISKFVTGYTLLQSGNIWIGFCFTILYFRPRWTNACSIWHLTFFKPGLSNNVSTRRDMRTTVSTESACTRRDMRTTVSTESACTRRDMRTTVSTESACTRRDMRTTVSTESACTRRDMRTTVSTESACTRRDMRTTVSTESACTRNSYKNKIPCSVIRLDACGRINMSRALHLCLSCFPWSSVDKQQNASRMGFWQLFVDSGVVHYENWIRIKMNRNYNTKISLSYHSRHCL